MLDFLNRFTSDIKKTNVVNNIKKLELDIQLKNKEIENFTKKMEHDKANAELNYQQSASKSSFMLMFILYGMCLGSVIMTPLGFGLLDKVIDGIKNGIVDGNFKDEEFVDFIITSILTSIIMVSGLMGFYFASISGQINKFFYRLKPIFSFITFTAIPISIAGNCNTLYSVMKFTNIIYIDLPIVFLVCILWDLSVIAGLRLRHDKKFKNYQYKEDVDEQESDKLTIFNMLKTFTFDFIKLKLMSRFYKMRKDIDKEYKKHNPKFKHSYEVSNTEYHENIQNIFNNPYDKSHENHDKNSNKKIINFHEKSHEISEINSNKNTFNFTLKNHDKNVNLGKKTDENSHDEFSLENLPELDTISPVTSHEKFDNFGQNNTNKTHETDETNSHENSNSNCHEKPHDNNSENNSNSHEKSHDKPHENNDKNNSNSHEKSHDKPHENNDKNNSNSHEKSHDKTGKRNTNKKNTLEKIENYINRKYKSGDKIIVKDLKKDLKLGEYDWTSNRKKLMKSNKVRVDGSDTYVA